MKRVRFMAVTLIEYQQICYKLLCFYDNICSEKNYKYILHYGTALGAVRHKGFIPWDDDVDVMMTYKDYKKLKKHFKKHNNLIDGISLDDHDFYPENPHALPRLRYNNSLVHEVGTEGLNMNNGIWLDIFTYHYCAKNKNLEKLQRFLIGTILMMNEKHRNRYKAQNGDTTHTKILIYRIADKLPDLLRLFLINVLKEIIGLLGNKKSDKYICDCNYVTKTRVFESKVLDQTTSCLFVDREFNIPYDYDEYLTFCFGSNYMTPIKEHIHINMDNAEIF